MKKAISILLALVIMAIPFSAFAEGTGSTEIIEHQYSTYTITIPETINTNEAPNIPITLSNANIEQGYKVVVSALNLSDGAVAIYNQNDSTITKYVTLIDSETQQKISNGVMPTFIESSFDVNETYEKTLNFMMTDDYSDYPAGIYSGTLQYQFDCVVNE